MPARVTKAELERLTAIALEAATLRRSLSALESESKSITAKAEADLIASGKESVTRGGYILDWTEGRLSVAWKDELIARLGAAVADEITTAAKRPRKIRVTHPRKPAAVAIE